MKRASVSLLSVIVATALTVQTGTPIAAQGNDQVQREGTEWSVSVLRPFGQPVIPIFDGWFPNPDGTFTLLFGYVSQNLEEAMDIPIGPDNVIEPREFDGVQPTHFHPVHRVVRRAWSVFSVVVPADFGDKRVTWTLRNRGKTFTVPGHIQSNAYLLDDLVTEARYLAATEGATQGDVIGAWAPALKLDRNGPSVRGIRGASFGPLSARVGEPLTLTAWVDPGTRPQSWLYWLKYQGPGDVVFKAREVEVDLIEGQEGTGTTTATFSEPGEYVLLVQSIEHLRNTFEYQCCWTNGYVKVTVTR